MRVLIGTDTYPPTVNGAAFFTERYARALAARGHEVHVVYPSPHGRAETVTDGDLTLHRTPSFPWPWYKNFRLSIPGRAGAHGVVAEIRPDVIHVQDHFWLCSAVVRAARSLGIPFIATNHLMPENFFDHVPAPEFVRRGAPKWIWSEVYRVFKGAAAVTSPTPKAVELLTKSTKFTAAIAVSNGIDEAAYEASAHAQRLGPGRYSAHPTVLFVGRLDQEKRVNELITAFAGLPPELGARLEIVGDGSLKHTWEKLADQLGVADKVKFLGFVSEEDLIAAFGRCDLFCMPGVAELQSIVTLEAMAAGKPVIAANAMALPHLVKPEVNGYLYTPGDTQDLRVRLETLLSDAGLRDRMGMASKQIVASHAMSSTIDKFVSLYEDAIAGVTHR